MTSEQILASFYRDLQKWIESGFPDHIAFRKYAGLCSNLNNYVVLQLGLSPVSSEPVQDEMTKQFEDAGLHYLYPFDPSSRAFVCSCSKEVVYNNRARLAWIKEHAK